MMASPSNPPFGPPPDNGLADEMGHLINVMDVLLARLVDARIKMERAGGTGTGHAETITLVDQAVDTMERLIPEYARVAAEFDRTGLARRCDRESRSRNAEDWLKGAIERKTREISARAGSAGEARTVGD
jgi:hypothetical protein